MLTDSGVRGSEVWKVDDVGDPSSPCSNGL